MEAQHGDTVDVVPLGQCRHQVLVADSTPPRTTPGSSGYVPIMSTFRPISIPHSLAAGQTHQPRHRPLREATDRSVPVGRYHPQDAEIDNGEEQALGDDRRQTDQARTSGRSEPRKCSTGKTTAKATNADKVDGATHLTMSRNGASHHRGASSTLTTPPTT